MHNLYEEMYRMVKLASTNALSRKLQFSAQARISRKKNGLLKVQRVSCISQRPTTLTPSTVITFLCGISKSKLKEALLNLQACEIASSPDSTSCV